MDDFPVLVLKGLHHHWKYALFLPGGLSKWKFSGGFTGKPKGPPFWGGSPNPFPLLLNPPLPPEPDEPGISTGEGAHRKAWRAALRHPHSVILPVPLFAFFLCSVKIPARLTRSEETRGPKRHVWAAVPLQLGVLPKNTFLSWLMSFPRSPRFTCKASFSKAEKADHIPGKLYGRPTESAQRLHFLGAAKPCALPFQCVVELRQLTKCCACHEISAQTCGFEVDQPKLRRASHFF